MSEFIDRSKHPAHTKAVHDYIMHDAPVGHVGTGAFNSHDPLPTRKGVDETSIGNGVNYTPASEAGHTTR
ncbi:MAG: hypothetical protein ACREDR_05335 [Blastocatellia bacterium]